MRAWEVAGWAFFAYVAVVALILPRLAAAGRWRALGGAAAGFGLLALSAWPGPSWILHGWVLPPAILLAAYWATGALFVAPMPRAERILEVTDHALAIPAIAARTPRPLAEILEIAYLGVYPLIPIALALHLLYVPGGDAERFWTVVLVTDFICFGMLPWVQTRPPRAFERADPWRSSVRPLNLRLLGAGSIQVNTFPSGHAAEALAAALLVTGAPVPAMIAVWLAALAVTAGTVLGRYHYTLDAMTGWLVAIVVWLAV
jgi:membrane-associated phospholipid phosphatase